MLPEEDADAAAFVAAPHDQRRRDARLERLRRRRAPTRRGHRGASRAGRRRSGARRAISCSSPLAARRTSSHLDLAAAGVAVDKTGVIVDDRLRTSNPRIFAAGDVCSPFKFTHAADAMARIVVQNALFFGRARASALVIPWCTYTDPEVAHVGWYADAARRKGHRVETITVPLADVDRAVVDEERDGFVRVHHERGRLLGCTVVSSRAGEMIGVPTHALTHGASLNDFGATISPVSDADQCVPRRRRRVSPLTPDAARAGAAAAVFPGVLSGPMRSLGRGRPSGRPAAGYGVECNHTRTNRNHDDTKLTQGHRRRIPAFLLRVFFVFRALSGPARPCSACVYTGAMAPLDGLRVIDLDAGRGRALLHDDARRHGRRGPEDRGAEARRRFARAGRRSSRARAASFSRSTAARKASGSI